MWTNLGSIFLSAFTALVWLNIFFTSNFLYSLYLMAGVVAYGYYIVNTSEITFRFTILRPSLAAEQEKWTWTTTSRRR